MHASWHAFTSQRCCIEGRFTIDDNAIDRYLLARLHDDYASDPHFIRIDPFKLSVLLDACMIRAYIHESSDALPASSYRIALEELPDLIEKHDRHSFGVIAAAGVDRKGDGTACCHSHQEAFIKHLASCDALDGFYEDIVSDHQVGDHIEDKPQDPGRWNGGKHCHQKH